MSHIDMTKNGGKNCLCIYHIVSRHVKMFGLTALLKWCYWNHFWWHALHKISFICNISNISNISTSIPHLTLDSPQGIFVTLIKGTIELPLELLPFLVCLFDHQIALGFASFCLYIAQQLRKNTQLNQKEKMVYKIYFLVYTPLSYFCKSLLELIFLTESELFFTIFNLFQEEIEEEYIFVQNFFNSKGFDYLQLIFLYKQVDG